MRIDIAITFFLYLFLFFFSFFIINPNDGFQIIYFKILKFDYNAHLEITNYKLIEK